MTTTLIDDHRAEIADLCRTYGVRRLEVFGSVVRDDFDPARSDVDFLVEYEPGQAPSLSGYFELRTAFESVLGRPVDLVMVKAVRNPYIKAAIDSERRLVHGS